jgi:hypothetical protein
MARLIDADALKERAIRVSTVKEHCYMKAVGTHEIDKAPTVVPDINVGKWIPVTERLPEEDGSYIVRTTTGAVTTARFYVGKTFPPTHYRPTEYHSPTQWQTNRNVTHWMPLPEPPKEVE